MRSGAVRLVLPASALIILFILAYFTGQTGIPVEDGGEFLTAARLGGVNHPPGLPLMSLSSRLSWILFGRDGLRVLFALLASTSMFLLMGRNSLSMILFSGGILLLPAVAGRLLMWDAYSPMFLIFAFTLLRKPRADLEGGYLTGLALGIHPQGIFLPILLRWRNPSPLKLMAGIILGLSVYLALPVNSAAGAIMDWGNTGGLANFIRQVTAGGYREVYGGSMGGISMTVLLQYLRSLWEMLWPVLLLPAVIGAVWMSGRDRKLMIRLEIVLLADLLFVAVVNPMAVGTTQTATLSMFVLIVFAIKGVGFLEKWKKTPALLMSAAVLAAGVMLWEPLPDQEGLACDFFSRAPLESGFFLRNNDLLYGGWVLKYVDDRRPDIVLLSPGNFSGWFEDMAMFFNPDIDLSKGVLDVGDFSMSREELSRLLIEATIQDNSHRRFFCDF